MKNQLEKLNIDCVVTRTNQKGEEVQGRMERQLSKMMVELFPSIILMMLEKEEDKQKLKELNPKAFK